MKPKNFPGRKNQRRIAALSRITGCQKNHSNVTTIENTKAKIVDSTVALTIHTKKNRLRR